MPVFVYPERFFRLFTLGEFLLQYTVYTLYFLRPLCNQSLQMFLLAVKIRFGQPLVGDIPDVEDKTSHNPILQEVDTNASHDPLGAVFVPDTE